MCDSRISHSVSVGSRDHVSNADQGHKDNRHTCLGSINHGSTDQRHMDYRVLDHGDTNYRHDPGLIPGHS